MPIPDEIGAFNQEIVHKELAAQVDGDDFRLGQGVNRDLAAVQVDCGWWPVFGQLDPIVKGCHKASLKAKNKAG
jgi:hypothetical protein